MRHEPTRGDELRAEMEEDDLLQIRVLACRLFPTLKPAQAVNRYLAEAENMVGDIERLLAAAALKELDRDEEET